MSSYELRVIYIIFVTLKTIIKFKVEEHICSKCKNYKTMDCPNSYLCYSRKDKPYFRREK